MLWLAMNITWLLPVSILGTMFGVPILITLLVDDNKEYKQTLLAAILIPAGFVFAIIIGASSAYYENIRVSAIKEKGADEEILSKQNLEQIVNTDKYIPISTKEIIFPENNFEKPIYYLFYNYHNEDCINYFKENKIDENVLYIAVNTDNKLIYKPQNNIDYLKIEDIIKDQKLPCIYKIQYENNNIQWNKVSKGDKMKYEHIYQGDIFYYEGSYWLKLLEDNKNKAVCLSSYHKELPEGHSYQLITERGEIKEFSDDIEVKPIDIKITPNKEGFLLEMERGV